MLTKNTLEKMLRENNVVVTFVKKDGTKRVLNCTLKQDSLPAMKNTTVSEKKHDHLICAYSVAEQQWRSFIVANVISADIAAIQ
jgi:hypothetical protein